MDGVSLHPTWVHFVATASAEDQIDFSLLLMTGIKKDGIHGTAFPILLYLQNSVMLQFP